MTANDPRTSEEIYNSIEATLKSNFSTAADKLSNFAPTSFNYIFTNAFAQEQHEQEVAATATQLSGWVDYTGKELTAEDLDELGIDGATTSEINEFQESEHLEQFAVAFGVTRDPGTPATGTLDVTTNSAVDYEAGSITFATQPNSDGQFYKFTTTEDLDVASAGTYSVPIIADEVGTDYNVGANTITYMPDPPAGISSVTNPAATSGGEGEQDDASLREDVKNAITESVDGGTVDGVEGYVTSNSGASSVVVDEYQSGDVQHGSYPHVHVIAFGGIDAEVEDAIDFAKPAGVAHFLVRPTQIQVNVNADLEGSGIDTAAVEDTLNNFFADLDLDEPVYRDRVIQEILNSDSGITNIQNLAIEVFQEPHTFQAGTDVYTLDKELVSDDENAKGITEVTGTLSGTSGHTFVEDTDYQEWNSVAGDTSEPHDSIDWSLAGDDPDDTTTFYVTYEVREDINIPLEEIAVLNQANITVV